MNLLLRLKHRLGNHPLVRPIVVNIDPNLTRAEFQQAARVTRETRHAAYRAQAGQATDKAVTHD